MTVWRSRVVSEQPTQGLTHQGLLYSALKRLFPNEEIINNARKETSFKSAAGHYVEVDIWIPEYDLCIEFQDLHHYTTTWYSQKELAYVQNRDSVKRDMVLADKRSLVVVPCWWDGLAKRIAASIHFYRPDLVFSEKYRSIPIPLNPSLEFLRLQSNIPEIGELMFASFPEDRSFADTLSPSNSWWMGEKYDGVRFCWDPTSQTLYSRKGLVIELIPEITDWLPATFLDGEIWFGRGSFPEAQKIVKTINFHDWWFFRMPTFDIPAKETEKFEFEERFRILMASIPENHPFAITVSRMLCSDEILLKDAIKVIVNKGGEGVILRQPRSLYERGRSRVLYKLKVTRGDSEAIVLSVSEDKSIRLKLPSGDTFIVPPQNVKVKPHPKKGDIVTFAYDDYSRKALPVNATIFQIRHDLAWDDVVANFLRESHSLFLNRSSQIAAGFTEHPFGYWNAEKGKNMRRFLEDFARSKNMDPLVPETWYNISVSAMKNDKGLKFIQYYSGGFVKAIVNLFPEIGVDESKFDHAPKNYWMDVARRKQFFIKFAQTHSFDPLVPENWYSIRHGSIVSAKGGKIVLGAYASGSVIQALIHLFPDIGLDETKFVTFPKNYWQDPNKRRQFFIWFAKKKGFNYAVADNWYKITNSSILPYKGARIILRMYSDNVADALLHLFPNIGLQREKFFPETLDWNSPARRRNFFIHFAAKNNFDPLVPDNWYSVTEQTILNHSQSAKKVLGFYLGDLTEALVSSFPNIGLEKSKFVISKDNYWNDTKNLRNFFEEFAKSNNFDPLVADNWYSVPRKLFGELPETKFFLTAFKGSMVRALEHTFPEIGIEANKFSFLHRKRYFMQLAKKFGFDALVPENWYNITKTHKLPNSLNAIVRQTGKTPKHVLEKFKGFEDALHLRSSKLAVALMSYFQTLNWEIHKFSGLSAKYWSIEKNRRKFFEDFANKQGFDPLVAANWYSISIASILQEKNVQFVLARHSNDPVTALMDLFPNIGFTKSQFLTPEKAFALKQIFYAFAKSKGFDPLVADNWYTVSRKDVFSFEGAKGLLTKHTNFAKTVASIFPDIGLNEAQFLRVSRNHWIHLENRKRVFDEYAKQHNFDPTILDNWFQRPKEKLLTVPGVCSIIGHYGGNLTKAITDIYSPK